MGKDGRPKIDISTKQDSPLSVSVQRLNKSNMADTENSHLSLGSGCKHFPSEPPGWSTVAFCQKLSELSASNILNRLKIGKKGSGSESIERSGVRHCHSPLSNFRRSSCKKNADRSRVTKQFYIDWRTTEDSFEKKSTRYVEYQISSHYYLPLQKK